LPNDILKEGVIRTGHGYSLVPGFVEGEGQYCASLIKTSEAEIVEAKGSRGASRPVKQTPVPGNLDTLFSIKMRFSAKGDTITAVPENIAADITVLRQYLHVIAAGCAVGTLKGQVLVPDADLALSLMLNEGAFPSVEVDRMTALSYLHRDAITLPADTEKGYVIIRHEGLPLGFVKNLGNRCNSLHPQSRRIRMDINR
jgi:NOL1/NOP2/fmu family ribosome biogenesis protein